MAVFRRLVFARMRGIFGSRIRYLISGGAPLPTEINRFSQRPKFQSSRIRSDRAAPVVAVNLHTARRESARGLPLKHIQVETAPDGELLLRGPNIMKGYYKLEAETKEAIDETDGCIPATSRRSTSRDTSQSPIAKKKSSCCQAARTSRPLTSRAAHRRQVHQPGMRDRRPPQASGGAGGSRLRKSRGFFEREQPRSEASDALRSQRS